MVFHSKVFGGSGICDPGRWFYCLALLRFVVDFIVFLHNNRMDTMKTIG